MEFCVWFAISSGDPTSGRIFSANVHGTVVAGVQRTELTEPHFCINKFVVCAQFQDSIHLQMYNLRYMTNDFANETFSFAIVMNMKIAIP